jgi:predicted dehydrogenase
VASTLMRRGLDYRPAFPTGYAPGVGIVGCGGIAKDWHLPAYGKYGVDVVGVFDVDPEATSGVRDRFPFVRRVFPSLDALLAEPTIEIVDIATGPDVRLDLVRQSVAARKHVLAQKPLALDPRVAREIVRRRSAAGSGSLST